MFARVVLLFIHHPQCELPSDTSRNLAFDSHVQSPVAVISILRCASHAILLQGASKVSLTFDATTTHVLKCGSSKFTEAAATDSIVHTLAGGGQASD